MVQDGGLWPGYRVDQYHPTGKTEHVARKQEHCIYGGGGSIGGAVAREFSHQGARVFLAGRTRKNLEAVANDIEADGGAAEVAVLDALDEQAVDEHAQAVVSQAGSIDISFNLIIRGDVQGLR